MRNQRWRVGRDSYRPSQEPINPDRYGVELIEPDRIAREFVTRNHYSGSYPAARCKVGLYRVRPGGVGTDLVGVAVFSVPMTEAVIPRWTGLPAREGIELGRLVLWDDVEGNGETWFLARAFQALRASLPEVQAVVSFSDPLQRISVDGRTVTPGHVGTVYQALNGRYVGRSKARTLLVAPDARTVSERMIQKLLREERGQDYARKQLLAWGAPAPAPFESPARWWERVRAAGIFRRVNHPGNLAYVWPLQGGWTRIDDQGRRVDRFPAALSYPKAATHRVHWGGAALRRPGAIADD